MTDLTQQLAATLGVAAPLQLYELWQTQSGDDPTNVLIIAASDADAVAYAQAHCAQYEDDVYFDGSMSIILLRYGHAVPGAFDDFTLVATLMDHGNWHTPPMLEQEYVP